MVKTSESSQNSDSVSMQNSINNNNAIYKKNKEIITNKKTDLFIYLISGFILGACILFYLGVVMSRRIINQTAYGLFWVIYIITIITIGNTFFNYYTYVDIGEKVGITGSVGEPGIDGDKGEDGECDRDCTLKSYSLVAENRLNKEYNKIIGKYIGSEPNPPKKINNKYITDTIKRIVDSVQFREISQIKHPNVVLQYVVEHFVRWFEIIINADESEGKKHFQDYMDVYGEQVEWEAIIKNENNPFHEIEKYDVFYWGLDKEFHPVKIKSCQKIVKEIKNPEPTGPLKVFRTNLYRKDYDDKKSGANRNVATWITQPINIRGETFYSLGSIADTEYNITGGGRFIEQIGPEQSNKINLSGNSFQGPNYINNIVVSGSSKWIRKPHPDAWSWKWDTKRKNNTRNRFRKSNYQRGTFWNAENFVEDGELFICQGGMITGNQQNTWANPSRLFGRDNVPFVCINSKALEEIPHQHYQIWDDYGFGTSNDGSVYTNRDGEYNLLYFQNGYSPEYHRKAYRIKRDLIDKTPMFEDSKFFTNPEEIDLGHGIGFQEVKYNKNRKHGMFDLLDLVVKSPVNNLYTNQPLFIEHSGLNRPNSYFVQIIDKEKNIPSDCIVPKGDNTIFNSCNPLENNQIWEIEFLGQSKEVCLLKSVETGKYLYTKKIDKFLMSGDIPERNINNSKLKPFLWRVLANK